MNNIKKGDLIRWYTTYNDDPSLVKDVGVGICLDVKVTAYKDMSKYKFIKVYRNKFNDIINLPESDVERFHL
ncbi:MAG: hypothetical protein CMC82_01085 [Flavobacteriaceae bacterium]|nr:hypothetical protein [Flavobacteriaceae bacterium]|tara:strand:- start:274 stop:489 length:216 start_codon:yes stop_codon:yes gene_type:complete